MSLEDYDILKVIGRGTYGEVHLVTHKKDKKQYVIKKLSLINASAKERKGAEQEAKLLSDLRHPNIVSYKDSFESATGHLYIVMGFAEGGDLYTKLKDHRERKDFLTEQQTVRWYIQICMALQYLHGKRILHRDLKTQNIFLTKTQIIKVGDLGIARVLENATDMATTLIGTPYYMSPELFSNKPYNHKSDVWALGCCMYEMVTLKHAFNAKDMNSLVFKILKGKMPPMPEKYPVPLCDLIREMLNQNPDKRPSVNKILRNPYIKKHIQLFLDESNRRRRPASERSSRKSSAVSGGVNSRPTFSRKTSTNSQGSLSPSPHPPSLAPDPAKPPRVTRARSPNIRPSSEPVEVKILEKVESLEEPKISEDAKKDPKTKNSDQSETDNTSKHLVETNAKLSSAKSSKTSQKSNENTNNSNPIAKYNAPGIRINFIETPQVAKVEIHGKPEVQNGSSRSPVPPARRKKESRPESASSSASSHTSTSSTKKSRRPLPDCPKVILSSEPKRKESSRTEEKLQESGESVTSVASSVVSMASNVNGAPRVKSARERRRERHEKVKPKTPDIVEEIRKSRSGGFKQPIKTKKNEVVGTKNTKKIESKEKVDNDIFVNVPDSRSGDAQEQLIRSREGSQALGILEQQQQPEIEEFVTLLHTTLHLGSEKELIASEDGDSPILVEDSERCGELSPVPELSESASSSATNQSHPFAKNTPAATPISVPAQAQYPNKIYNDAKQRISKGTLRSTQRLMDRIVSLRKECIKQLGVPLLHRAYEVLDANEDDDVLRKELVALLGPVRFEQWASMIWQLKYCEESMFGHCGTITA